MLYNLAEASISKCDFINNTGFNGGCLYNSGTMTLNSNNFQDNSASKGSCIYNTGTLTFNSNTLKNNNASNGGCIYNSGKAQLKSNNFISNFANNGACIYNTGNTKINSNTFTKNKAKNKGGSIYNTKSLNIVLSKFTSNSANYGGSIFNKGKLEISSTTFTNNNATNGSAIYNTKNLIITSSSFKNNCAKSYTLKSSDYTTKKGKTLKIKAYLEYGDNYNGIYSTKNFQIDNTQPILSSALPKQVIYLTINNSTYKQKTNSEGYAYFKINTNKLQTSSHQFKLTHPKSSISTAINNTYTLKIKKDTKKITKKDNKPKKDKKSKKTTKDKHAKKNKSKNKSKKSKYNKNLKKALKSLKKDNKKAYYINKKIYNQAKKYGLFDWIVGAAGNTWKWWNSPAIRLGPNYAKTLKSLGILGDGIGLALDFVLGIDKNGEITWGNLIIDIISLIPVFGAGSKAVNYLTRKIPQLSKYKSVFNFFKKNKKFYKWATDVIGVLDNGFTFLSNKGNALLSLPTSVVKDALNGGKVTTRLIKIFKNNKYVKAISNSSGFKKFWNSGLVKGFRENKYVRAVGKGFLDFVDNGGRSVLSFATSFISTSKKIGKTIISKKYPNKSPKPKKLDYSRYAKNLIKSNHKVFKKSKTKYDKNLKFYTLVLNDVSHQINPKYSNWKKTKAKSKGASSRVSSGAKYVFKPKTKAVKSSSKTSINHKRNFTKRQNNFRNIIHTTLKKTATYITNGVNWLFGR